MDKTAKQIRRAFENITPNVLDRVLSQSNHEKGVVIPMNEKKPVIPFILKKITTGAALIALVVCVGYVGLMILGGRASQQLSGMPTEAPTEAPVEIDLENLKLNAAKLDKDGKEIGTTQITIHVTQGEENKITDIKIDPFGDWKGFASPIDSTTGAKFEIRQVGVHATGRVNMATLSGFATDNLYYFCTLYFTDDFEHLILDVPTNTDRNYYAAAAGNNLTAKEIIGYFEDIGVTLFPMDSSEFYPAMNLTQEEFDQLLTTATAYEIWHYSVSATGQLSYTVNGKTYTIQSMDKIYSTSEKADLDAVRNSFADWALADHQISYGEMILSPSNMYLVIFDNGLVIGTIENFDLEDSGDVRVKGYGEVNRTLFFLPDAFCELLRSKVGS